MKTIKTAILIILFCFLCFIVAMYLALSKFGTYSDNTTLIELKHATGLHFPYSTKLEHCINTSMQDSFYYAEVRIKTGDVPSLISSIASSKPGYKTDLEESETDRLGITNEMHSEKWWKPDSAHKFHALRINRRNKSGYVTETIQAFVVLDESIWATVYIDYTSD